MSSASAFMNLNAAHDEDEGTVIADINTTPLVDVMLVLLIILLITIQVVAAKIEVQLPTARNEAVKPAPENVNLSVDREGNVYWGLMRLTTEELFQRFAGIATQVPQPEIHVRGDQKTRYEHVGRVIYTAQRAGIQKVGFITDPGRPQ